MTTIHTEAELHKLLDGLANGDKLTVEFREDDRVTICVGSADVGYDEMDRDEVDVYHALGNDTVRWYDRNLHDKLHSVTVTREVTKRWEARHTEK